VAEVRPITIKRTQGGEAVVGSGLKVGEQVVTDGQLRLVNGAAVNVKPAQSEVPKIAQPRG
jgi:multidrug efflux system membrane fusion protein